MEELVDPSAQIETLATGFIFLEGPVWHHRERHLTFADNRQESLFRWSEGGGVSVWRHPSGHASGNTYDHDGWLVSCEMEGRCLSRIAPDGRVEIVASEYNGKRLSSVNDAICAPNGDLLFTCQVTRKRQPNGDPVLNPDGSYVVVDPFVGVMRALKRDGSVQLLLGPDKVPGPNGLTLSDDGKHLLVADTRNHHVRSFELLEDGGVRDRGIFVDLTHAERIGRPDGMKLDQSGNLYIAANTDEGVWVYHKDGTLLGFIGVGDPPANLAWGEDDWRTLYITGHKALYRVRMRAAGQPVIVP